MEDSSSSHIGRSHHQENTVEREDRAHRASYPESGGKSPGDSAIEAFSLFRDYLDTQLKDFKKDLNLKLHDTPSVKFKKEANRIQYEFNLDILRSLEVVADDKFRIPAEIFEKVSSVISKVKHRNNLIKVADSSPGGWLTVNEYEKPVLGSDSEDEKRLKQAEARAVRKIKATTSTSKPSFNPYKRPVSTFMPRESPSDTVQWGKPAYSFRGTSRQSSIRDICFACGQRGHFRHECRFWSNSTKRFTPDNFKRSSSSESSADKRTDK
ncbi:uncharacterized protein LOC132735441 [Ruditapes philippinarum]|uniref:uncharacterized protein LOC132735441 n=1 Tax=Ruditapes philippinarum TaxID=129788 RepID=UPI00295A9076|nr:uncharacterized protein LOC132735441 [Ruditapes philippinarum]